MYVGLFFCSFFCVSLDNEYSRAADNLGLFLPDQGFCMCRLPGMKKPGAALRKSSSISIGVVDM